MNWRLWARGLIAAGINAVASSITVFIVDPHLFDWQNNGPKLVSMASVSALVGMALYLKEHPLPD